MDLLDLGVVPHGSGSFPQLPFWELHVWTFPGAARASIGGRVDRIPAGGGEIRPHYAQRAGCRRLSTHAILVGGGGDLSRVDVAESPARDTNRDHMVTRWRVCPDLCLRVLDQAHRPRREPFAFARRPSRACLCIGWAGGRPIAPR